MCVCAALAFLQLCLVYHEQLRTNILLEYISTHNDISLLSICTSFLLLLSLGMIYTHAGSTYILRASVPFFSCATSYILCSIPIHKQMGSDGKIGYETRSKNEPAKQNKEDFPFTNYIILFLFRTSA